MKDTVINYTNLKQITNLERRNPRLALKKACAEFESFLWYEILKGLDKTVIKSGFFPESLDYKIYQDYLYQEIARKVSGRPGGLGNYLYKTLLKSPYFKKVENNADNK